MLNKNGWGFRAYIIFSSILLLALLGVTLLIIRLYRSFPEIENAVMDTSAYYSIENTVNDMALRYAEYRNKDTNDTMTVSTKKLISLRYIDKDDLHNYSTDDVCSGYALVRKNEDGTFVSDAYIKCDHYTTSGYQSWRVD